MSILKLQDLRLKIEHLEISLSAELNQQITGIFGPSGAGKTTLLELVAGIKKPTHGSISIGSDVVTDSSTRTFVRPEHRRVGYVPQDLALFPHLTVRENLLYSTRGHHEPGHYEEILATLEITQLLSRFPENLSGGEKQRVAIGRALMSSPRILLLDEPLANLDSALKSTLLELLRTVAARLSLPILYVTHDADELAALVEEVLIVQAGKLVRQGRFSQLFSTTESRSFQPIT